jgi:phosphotriesterase-related protein
MPEAVVVTVLGPIAPEKLGVTDAHDHLFLRSPALPGQEFDDAGLAMDEVGHGKKSGLQAIVEVTPIGCGRRPAGMREVAEKTGLHIVAATGYHRDAHYPENHWVREATVELLAERIVADLDDGMHPDDWLSAAPLDAARAGVIKAGASYQHISRLEQRRLVAAAVGHRQTGAAILVHTEIGTCAHAIIDLLTREGVKPESIILAHLDRNPDFELHSEVAARGVMLEYDTPGRIKYRPDSELIDLMEAMTNAGQIDHLLLGLDLGMRDYFRAYGGGPGLGYLMDVFVPRLRKRVGEAAVDTILVANAARALAFARPSESS